MRVCFTAESMTRLRAIHAYIARDSVSHADAMIDRITCRAMALATFPQSGRAVPEYAVETLREVPEPPYRIIYRIQADMLQIVTVMHGRQLLPDDLL